MTSTWVLVGAGAAAVALGLSAEAHFRAPVAADHSFVIEHARIFDGNRILDDATVFVRDDTIRAVGRDIHVPEGMTRIDGRGKTVLPGLIDSHIHYLAPASLRQAIVFGVTTALDMGGNVQLTREVERRQASGDLADMADLRTAGTLITAPGGHGTEYGLRIPTLAPSDDPDAFVEARIREGSDYIKIIYDDGHTYAPLPTLTREQLTRTIWAAHQRRKLAVVHVASLPEARHAVLAGADGLMHLFVDSAVDDRLVEEIRKRHTFVVPTLVVMEKITERLGVRTLVADSSIARYLAPSHTADLRRSFPVRSAIPVSYQAAERSVRALKAAGIPLLAGSDAGAVQGVLLLHELELLVGAGLTPTEALASATSAPARAFGLDDRGTLRIGMRADLLLVAGDPSKDISALRRLERVWKLGREVDREAFATSLADEKAADARQRLSAPPAGSEVGLVADFDNGSLATRFGSGWFVSTDSVSGGHSIASLSIAHNGAQGSAGALHVEGEVRPGVAFGWAGALFVPYVSPNRASNLAAKKTISFWAKGDGQTYGLQLSSRSYGYVPATKRFVAGHKWHQYTFPLAEFDGMDGHDLTALQFVFGPRIGKFSFEIDDVWIR